MKVKRMWKGFLIVLALICMMCAFSACNKISGSFNLTFKLDGETYQTVTTSGSETIEIPQNPTKVGYEFDGWYWDNGVWSKPFTANSLLDAPISSDMSVYAKFNIIEYNIAYEAVNGTHSNPSKYTVEDTITLAAAEKTGYVFNGWYKDAEYTEKIEAISNSTGDIILYANYDIETYDITYANTKDVENLNPVNYTVESDDISLLPLSKIGYTFDGWYNGENKVDKIEKGNFGNISLTAKWLPISYSLNYNNVEGATHSNPATYNVDEQPLTLQDAVKNGYEFLGWYDDSTYTNKVMEISSGTTEGVELYAKWEIIEYKATFKDGDITMPKLKILLFILLQKKVITLMVGLATQIIINRLI